MADQGLARAVSAVRAVLAYAAGAAGRRRRHADIAAAGRLTVRSRARRCAIARDAAIISIAAVAADRGRGRIGGGSHAGLGIGGGGCAAAGARRTGVGRPACAAVGAGVDADRGRRVVGVGSRRCSEVGFGVGPIGGCSAAVSGPALAAGRALVEVQFARRGAGDLVHHDLTGARAARGAVIAGPARAACLVRCHGDRAADVRLAIGDGVGRSAGAGRPGVRCAARAADRGCRGVGLSRRAGLDEDARVRIAADAHRSGAGRAAIAAERRGVGVESRGRVVDVIATE